MQQSAYNHLIMTGPKALRGERRADPIGEIPDDGYRSHTGLAQPKMCASNPSMAAARNPYLLQGNPQHMVLRDHSIRIPESRRHDSQ